MDIQKILEKSNSIAEALTMMIDALNKEYEKTHNLKIKEKISALQHYNSSIHNKTLIADHRKEFNALYSLMDKQLPEMLFRLDGNKKSLKSFLEKVDMLQSNNKSLDSAFKDIHRFRLTIINSNIDTVKNIELLEKATNITLEHFICRGYTLCQPNPVKDIIDINNPDEAKKFKDENPDAFLLAPKASTIKAEYQSRIKNYVIEPKKNGYQRIHLFFADSKSNLFEIQLGTFAMQVRADVGGSSHQKFREKTRNIKTWDLSKINIPGFKYLGKDPITDTPLVIDNVGLVSPVETFVRRKTF